MTEKKDVFAEQWFLGNKINLNTKEGFTELFELIDHHQETGQVNSQSVVAIRCAGLLQAALRLLEQTRYELRVTQLESSGMTRSDAQSVAEAEAISGGAPDTLDLLDPTSHHIAYNTDQDPDKCLRCGESLDMTFPDLAETGICADCWTEDDNLDGEQL
jgi:hypothetical protein